MFNRYVLFKHYSDVRYVLFRLFCGSLVYEFIDILTERVCFLYYHRVLLVMWKLWEPGSRKEEHKSANNLVWRMSVKPPSSWALSELICWKAWLLWRWSLLIFDTSHRSANVDKQDKAPFDAPMSNTQVQMLQAELARINSSLQAYQQEMWAWIT